LLAIRSGSPHLSSARWRRRSRWQAAFLLQSALTSARPADKTRALFRQAVSFASRNGRSVHSRVENLKGFPMLGWALRASTNEAQTLL
jgi:hypothetical protein